jgi:2,5-diamino-6-(ribosylamino)-4(3H)-pyrimidinone 5'-phosphate reductase
MFEWIQIVDKKKKPWVTLTFAQTVDGFIAKKDEKMVISGKESLEFTHTLRCSRDAILVGIGTVLVDFPSLTVRYISKNRDGGPVIHPRPVIVDSHVQCPLDAPFMNRNPIILTGEGNEEKKAQLEQVGATIVVIPFTNGKLDLGIGLEKLYELGIQSVMVEGGARIIHEFLNSSLPIDDVYITIAPRLLGSGIHGISGNTMDSNIQVEMHNVQWHILGKDVILSCLLKKLDL